MVYTDEDTLAATALRMLAIDAVQAANSGHPGLPLGAADMAIVLWTRFLKHDASQPTWADRDRFVLSAGHGSRSVRPKSPGSQSAAWLRFDRPTRA